MQKITLVGRLGRDAAIREMQEGGKVVSFTVAANGRYRGVEKTSWYDVSTFNYDRYKNMVKYLTKGSSVIVVGELDCDIEEGRDGVMRCRRSVNADSIEFNSNGVSGGTGNNVTTEETRSKRAADEYDEDEEPTMKTSKKSKARDEEEEEDAPKVTKKKKTRDEEDEEEPPKTRKKSRSYDEDEDERGADDGAESDDDLPF